MMHTPCRYHQSDARLVDAYHHAAEFVERGWSIIPLVGKVAAIKWKRHQQVRATYADLKHWFGQDNPRNYNVGIVTGPISGLVVVDCDSEKAIDWFRSHFPPTPLGVTTGRRAVGAHFYYRLPRGDDVGNRAGILGRKGIDIRCRGGYVVAPPSFHPETGMAYQWHAWGHYALEEVPVFDPNWLEPPSAALLPDRGRTAREVEANAGPPLVLSTDELTVCACELLQRHPEAKRLRYITRRLARRQRDRSACDFWALCEFIRLGLTRHEAWCLVFDKSKFRDRGQPYFDLTFHRVAMAAAGRQAEDHHGR